MSMWDNVVGQPEVVNSLTSALGAGKLSHAYLFVGPQGLGKLSAAQAIAATLMCPDGGCGKCNVCQRIQRCTHPDFRILEPEGATGYLAEQIRTLIRDVTLAPMEATQKVYVIRSADMLSDSSANAFLKTLEEPPPHVTIILLAHTIEPIIPTILSRCLVIRFKSLPQDEMVNALIERTFCSPEQALVALAACGGSLGEAVEFARSHARRVARETIVRIFRDLTDADDLDVLNFAKEIMVGVKGPVEELAQKQEQDLVAQAELLDRVAIKALEGYNGRRLKAYELRSVSEVMNILQSLLRDTLCSCQGVGDIILNVDAHEIIADVGCVMTPAAVHRGFKAIERARMRLAQNVGSQLIIEVLLFDIREVLVCPR